jgi:hypothetical protein
LISRRDAYILVAGGIALFGYFFGKSLPVEVMGVLFVIAILCSIAAIFTGGQRK